MVRCASPSANAADAVHSSRAQESRIVNSFFIGFPPRLGRSLQFFHHIPHRFDGLEVLGLDVLHRDGDVEHLLQVGDDAHHRQGIEYAPGHEMLLMFKVDQGKLALEHFQNLFHNHVKANLDNLNMLI